MTKILVQPKFPAPLPEKRFAKNTNLPSTTFFRRAAVGINHAGNVQARPLFSKAYDTQSTPAGVLTATNNTYWIFRTGETVEEINVLLGLVPTDTDYSLATPQAIFKLFTTGGSTISSSTAYHGIIDQASPSSTYTPDQVDWVPLKITTDDGLAANTVYVGWIELTYYCRLHSILCYETAPQVIQSSGDGVVDALRYEQMNPIYDADIQDLLVQSTNLWRHNARMLFSWSRKSAASATTVNSGTWTNIVSGSTAGWSSASAGFQCNTTYDVTYSDSEVPVELGIYASRTSGAGNLEMRILSSSGQEFTNTITASTGAGGSTSTHLLSAADDKFDIEMRRTSTSVWDVYCVALWEYEA